MHQTKLPPSTASGCTHMQSRDSGRTTVLLTGFGPFPKVPTNATMTLVPKLAKAARTLFPGVRFISEILATEWIAAPARVDRLIVEHRPDIILHFGVSSRARGFEIESRGCNACVTAPDAGGVLPRTACVRDGGEQFLPSRVPVNEIVRRLRLQQLPAYRSWNAGAYLCNATLYHVLAETDGGVGQAGFVHIPVALAPANPATVADNILRTSPRCPLSWPQTLIGGIEIIATLLDQPSPSPARRAHAMVHHA